MAMIERERVTTIGGVPTVMWRIVEAETLRAVRPVVGAAASGTAARRPRPSSSSASRSRSRRCARRSRPRTGSPRPRRSRRPTPATTTSRTRARSAAPRRRSRSRSSTTTASRSPLGENGEIWLRGPTIMSRGYWNRPDATDAATLPDGWFHTGDIGYLDADGFLYLVDRAKDMIIRAGENVYCVEIENVLFEHPDVLDAAVVGVPHKRARRRGEGGRAAARRLDDHRRGRARVLRASGSPTSRCRSTSSCATSRCRATPRARC